MTNIYNREQKLTQVIFAFVKIYIAFNNFPHKKIKNIIFQNICTKSF